jgi:hypothetical protein
LLAARTPLPFFPPLHVIFAVLVFVVDTADAEAVPYCESPGGAKVTVCPGAPFEPAHTVFFNAPALPVVATCTTPNERIGTEHNIAPAMSLRNTINSLPNFCMKPTGGPLLPSGY